MVFEIRYVYIGRHMSKVLSRTMSRRAQLRKSCVIQVFVVGTRPNTNSHAYSLNKFEIHLIKFSCNTTVTRWPVRSETRC